MKTAEQAVNEHFNAADAAPILCVIRLVEQNLLEAVTAEDRSTYFDAQTHLFEARDIMGRRDDWVGWQAMDILCSRT